MSVAINKEQEETKKASQSYVLSHALMFIGGFTLVFVLIGVTTGLLAGITRANIIDGFITVGGVLLLILGIHMLGVVKWITANMSSDSGLRKTLVKIDRKMDELILPERRAQAGYGQSPGYFRSSIIGMTFAAGWTPCIGPLLGAILTLSIGASSSANVLAAVGQSALLLFAYSMGLAVPFLLAAWLLNRASGYLRKMNRYVHIIEKVSAVLIIIIGAVLLFSNLSQLNQYFAEQPEWIYNIELALSTQGLSLPIAFAAGLLSFLSPCVLPLIPVYIGYLTGVGAAATNTASTAS